MSVPDRPVEWPVERAAEQRPPVERQPRWGARALWFLALAALALVVAAAQGRHTVGTLGSTIIGLAGAARCSLIGVRAMHGIERIRQR